MKVLVIEDEKYGFENICRLLKQIEQDLEINGPVTNVVDMKNCMQQQNEYDIIFADIKLEDGLSFEALSDVSELTTPIVFVTAYDEYAIDAFKVGGIGYILKPIDKSELQLALKRALQMKRGCQNIDIVLQAYDLPSKTQFASRLLVRDYDGISVLQVSTISHLTFIGGKVYAYTMNESQHILSARSLDTVFAQLNPKSFFRANRQYIINIDAIKKIHLGFRQTENIELKDYADLRINVSKERVFELHNWLEQN